MSRWLPWVAFVLVVVGYGLEHSARTRAEARLAVRDASIVALTREADSLRDVFRVDTVRVDSLVERWRVIAHHDTLPGRVDTLLGVRQIIAVADTTIRVCQVTVADCARLAQTERARADSLAADVADWKKLAGGPWIRPAVELTTGPNGLLPAGEVTLGHQLQVLGRLDVPLTSAPVWRVGVRWVF